MALDALKKVPNNIKQLLREKAREIRKLSRQEVPKRSGTLKKACEVYESNEGGFHVGVRYRPDRYNEESMKFTGEYMLKQHEYSWLEHPNGGKAKFLEDPFRLVAATLSRSIRERIRWSLDNTGEWPGYSEEDNDS